MLFRQMGDGTAASWRRFGASARTP